MNSFAKFKTHWVCRISSCHDSVRSDARYARYPVYAMLLGVMLHGVFYFPYPQMSMDSMVRLLLNPVSRAIDMLVFTGGPILAVLLGLLGLVRTGIMAKTFSLLGMGLGLNIWCMNHMWTNLVETVVAAAQELWFATIAMPASLVYELSGKNESVALAVWVLCTMALYMLLRAMILKGLRRPRPAIGSPAVR
jgi:hypothetical protein